VPGDGAGFNGIGWFEIGTDDPAAAERFYGDVFGWTVSHDDTKSTDPAYQIFTTGDAEGLHGGLFATKGRMSRSSLRSERGAGTSAVTETEVIRSVRKARRASRSRHQAPDTRYQWVAVPT